MPLKINNQIIEQVSTFKYLGVTNTIDEKLHCSDHMNNTKSKAKNKQKTKKNTLLCQKIGSVYVRPNSH